VNYPFSVLLDPTTTPVVDLSFAAEEHGATRTPEALAALLTLIDHADAVVREGVVYGLSNYLDNAVVCERLRLVATSDPSPGVRAAAADCNRAE